MRVEDALTGTLAQADAEILLGHLLGKPRTWLLAHSEEALTPTQETDWQQLVARRKNHEPVAYITGHKEFFNRDFIVNPSVLIPRPATEHLIEAAKKYLENPFEGTIDADQDIIIAVQPLRAIPPTTIVDIGTGSGCIAITMALECPHMHVIGTDISPSALAIAHKNAEHLHANVMWKEGSMLEPASTLKEPFLLVSNPPYIPDNAQLMKDVADYEPHSALFGGPDGGDLVREIMKQAAQHPHCIGLIMERLAPL